MNSGPAQRLSADARRALFGLLSLALAGLALLLLVLPVGDGCGWPLGEVLGNRACRDESAGVVGSAILVLLATFPLFCFYLVELVRREEPREEPEDRRPFRPFEHLDES